MHLPIQLSQTITSRFTDAQTGSEKKKIVDKRLTASLKLNSC